MLCLIVELMEMYQGLEFIPSKRTPLRTFCNYLQLYLFSFAFGAVVGLVYIELFHVK
jgi:hypothetical protein